LLLKIISEDDVGRFYPIFAGIKLLMNRVLYNVTCSVDPEIHEEWLDWMMFKHIPDVMNTGMFLENRICRIHEYEDNGVTYAIQYVARHQKDLNEYMERFAPALQKEHADKYGSRVAAFRTTLEIVHEIREPYPSVNPN
jgi:hypothetical protein